MEVPLLHAIENITYPAQLAALRTFYAGPASSFKVYLDNAETDIADIGWVSFKPVEGTDTFRVTVKNETQATHAIPVRIEALSIAQEA